MMSKISSPLFGKFERKHNKFEVIGLFLYSTLREKCRIRSFSGPYFHAFGLNTEIYEVWTRTWLMITQVLQTIRATFKETKRNTEEIYKSQISNIQTNLHHWKSCTVWLWNLKMGISWAGKKIINGGLKLEFFKNSGIDETCENEVAMKLARIDNGFQLTWKFLFQVHPKTLHGEFFDH